MSEVKLEISKDLVKNIVEERIKAGIVSELSKDSHILIEEIVSKILTKKVDDKGQVSQYESYNKYNLIDRLVHQEIVKVAGAAIAEYVQGKKDDIKKEIEASLKKNTKLFASAMVESLIDKAGAEKIHYRLQVETDSFKEERYQILQRLEEVEKKIKK